jgi:hypothetical protein
MIYLSADLHLERYIWTHRRDLDGDSYQALESMKKFILEDKVPAGESKSVILAGDIFDKRRVDGLTIQAFADFVDDLFEAGITIFFIQGDHDKNHQPIPESLGCEPLNEAVTIIDDRAVYGLDWRPRSELQAWLDEVPACDILVLHAAFDHLLPWEGAFDLTMDDIPKTVNNVFVGDVHMKDQTRLNGRGFCISPGCLHATSIDSTAPKGFWKLPAASEDWEWVQVWARSIYRYVVKEEAEFSRLATEMESIAHDDPKPIVEIKYTTDLTEKVLPLLDKYKEQVFFFTKPIAAYAQIAFEKEAVYEQMTLNQALPIALEKDENPELFGLLDDLLSGDAVEIINNQVDKIKEPEHDTAEA